MPPIWWREGEGGERGEGEGGEKGEGEGGEKGEGEGGGRRGRGRREER